MSSIDQQFVEYIVKSLVSKPDSVTIERRIDEKGVLLELTVDPEDLGRVIGKRGATAQSLRTLLRALGTKNDARYNLKIVDNGEPRASYSGGMTDAGASTTAIPAGQDTGTDSGTAASLASDDDVDDPVVENDESDHSSVVSKTRKELEDLDDLDV